MKSAKLNQEIVGQPNSVVISGSGAFMIKIAQ